MKGAYRPKPIANEEVRERRRVVRMCFVLTVVHAAALLAIAGFVRFVSREAEEATVELSRSLSLGLVVAAILLPIWGASLIVFGFCQATH